MNMTDKEEEIRNIAGQYGLQIIYAFGSRAEEACDFLKNRMEKLAAVPSDVDIAVKPGRSLTLAEKVEITLRLEDLFGVNRIDLIVLPEAPTFLALDAVTGELVYAVDDTLEAEYQLYVMRRAAELLPYERQKISQVLGVAR